MLSGSAAQLFAVMFEPFFATEKGVQRFSFEPDELNTKMNVLQTPQDTIRGTIRYHKFNHKVS